MPFFCSRTGTYVDEQRRRQSKKDPYVEVYNKQDKRFLVNGRVPCVDLRCKVYICSMWDGERKIVVASHEDHAVKRRSAERKARKIKQESRQRKRQTHYPRDVYPWRFSLSRSLLRAWYRSRSRSRSRTLQLELDVNAGRNAVDTLESVHEIAYAGIEGL